MLAIYSGSVYIIPVSYSFSDQISSRDLRALTFYFNKCVLEDILLLTLLDFCALPLVCCHFVWPI